MLIFSEPIESVYPRFTKLKFFLATVSSLWNANVTRSSLSLTIGVSSTTTIRLPKLLESKKYSTTIFFTTIITTAIFSIRIIPTAIQSDDDDMEAKRAITRWNRNEEILLAETWIEHSQLPISEKTNKMTFIEPDYGKFQLANNSSFSEESDDDLVENAKQSFLQRYGNKKFQYDRVWNILKNYLKWNAAKPIDKDNLQELFGPDPRERPADKQQAPKKQKSVDTSRAGGNTRGSTGGSQSESVSGVLSHDYRRRCDVAEKEYEAKREKEIGILPHWSGGHGLNANNVRVKGSQDASMLHNQTDCMKEQGYLEDLNTENGKGPLRLWCNEDNDTMNELEDGDKTTSDEYENKNTDSDSPVSDRIVRTNGDEIDGKNLEIKHLIVKISLHLMAKIVAISSQGVFVNMLHNVAKALWTSNNVSR
uniref:No apical meristem-associated C-terminal domain-containing protein n=1 Tax=Tanacetum cinerariifolium TaxID=118510 RepID=A0A6L2LFB4_TANCI|nr:hypothetical protein [Tanacetum cinerariifolium]